MPSIIEYKCPQCGGILEFDSKLQKMKCPYCDATFEMAELQGKDEALNQQPQEGQAQGQRPDQMQWQTPNSQWAQGETDSMGVYTCKSCGGEIVADANTGATHCPFCGNPVVLTARFAGALKPDLVIPFQLDKKAAKEKLKQFMTGKKLLPKAFKSDSHLDEIKGVYVPYWLFDADADAQIKYHATRTRTWSDSQYQYTETQHFDVFRAGYLGFDAVPVDGSSKMPDDLMESLEPFDVTKAVPFQTAYLSGYLADKYDVTADASISRANERIRQTTEQTFSSTVNGYASVVPEYNSIQLANAKARYALYPVWLLNSTWQGKQYQFAMNGQTGKFVGDLPMDKGAYWKWRILYGVIIAAVIFGIACLVKLFLG